MPSKSVAPYRPARGRSCFDYDTWKLSSGQKRMVKADVAIRNAIQSSTHRTDYVIPGFDPMVEHAPPKRQPTRHEVSMMDKIVSDALKPRKFKANAHIHAVYGSQSASLPRVRSGGRIQLTKTAEDQAVSKPIRYKFIANVSGMGPQPGDIFSKSVINTVTPIGCEAVLADTSALAQPKCRDKYCIEEHTRKDK